MRRIWSGLAVLIVAGISFCLAGVNAHAASPEEGYWKSIDAKTGNTTAYWHLIEKNGVLNGYIVKYKGMKPDDICETCKGDAEAWKGKPILGTAWMMMTSKGSNGVWDKGYIIDSRRGKKFKVEVWMEGQVLKIKPMGLIKKTQSWAKSTKEEAEGARL